MFELEILTTIQQYYNDFIEFSRHNPVVAGVISLWFLGVTTFLLRNVPITIWHFIKRQLTTTMTLNNTSYTKSQLYYAFLAVAKEREFLGWSRNFMTTLEDPHDPASAQLSAGYGIHFFFYRGRPYWFNIEQLDSSGSENQKEQITINTIGRDNKILERLFDLIIDKINIQSKNDSYVFTFHDSEWWSGNEIPQRPVHSIAMNPEVNDFVFNKIQKFIDSKDWYTDNGVPYKMASIMHGRPGTGKTSLIKAIASYYNRNICILSLDEMSDKSLMKALSSVPSNSIVVIEDFDSSPATKDRVQTNSDGDNKFSFLTLSGILNTLDGVNELRDVIIIMTTNHLENVDQAIYRKGRIDHIVKVDELRPDVVRSHVERIHPCESFDDVKFAPMLGCHLHSAIIESQGDSKKFKSYIKDVYDSEKNLEVS